jgi:hypothetical protein
MCCRVTMIEKRKNQPRIYEMFSYTLSQNLHRYWFVLVDYLDEDFLLLLRKSKENTDKF